MKWVVGMVVAACVAGVASAGEDQWLLNRSGSLGRSSQNASDSRTMAKPLVYDLGPRNPVPPDKPDGPVFERQRLQKSATPDPVNKVCPVLLKSLVGRHLVVREWRGKKVAFYDHNAARQWDEWMPAKKDWWLKVALDKQK